MFQFYVRKELGLNIRIRCNWDMDRIYILNIYALFSYYVTFEKYIRKVHARRKITGYFP